jgi:uncharacterized RDD family membrane protein YckC
MESTTPHLAVPKSHPPKVRTSHPAGFFSRLLAFSVDLIILNVVQFVGSVFVQYFLNFFRLLKVVNFITVWLQDINSNLGTGVVLTVLLVIAYFSFFWSLVGYTPGKALLSLKVVRPDGTNPSFGRSILRFFSYWISAIPLFLGFFWVIWDSKRQGWHDKIAGTQVVYIPRRPHK